LFLLLLALILDWFAGDPPAVWTRIPHPVVILGKIIDFLEHRLNRRDLVPVELRKRGFILVAVLVATAAVSGLLLQEVFSWFGVLGFGAEVVLVAVFIAQKGLIDHVDPVVDALRSNDMAAARQAIAQIVGRDPQSLDESGISRAAIETLAENFADGVVAPVLWYAVFGLPGLLAYKAINTADSMIGHKSTRYRHFGKIAAELDDAVNWPASRLSAVLIAIGVAIRFGHQKGRHAFDVATRDAGLHRSPNAGWPEAAMAGGLDIALGGPRSYGGDEVNETRLNAGCTHELKHTDISRALKVFSAACFALWALVGVFVVF
jgi:adenosylcobinamide-phosphate synthase